MNAIFLVFGKKFLMQLHRQSQVQSPQDHCLDIEQSWGNRVLCSCVVHLKNDVFLEYQSSLFEEFFAEMMEQLGPDASMKKFRKWLENALQEFNSKLSMFAEKVKQDVHFEIKGYIQVVIDGEYLNSLIGPTAIVIIRKNKVAYTVVNDIIKSAKISNFADIVEGELKHDDRIVLAGCVLDTYVDQEDMQSLLDDAIHRESSFLDDMHSLLSKRVTPGELPFVYEYQVEDYVPGFAGKIGIKAVHSKKYLQGLGSRMLQYRHELMIAGVGLFMTFLGWWTISGFMQQKSPSFVTGSGETQTVTVKDVQKDIALFDRIAADSDEKIKKYEEIQQKISILDTQKTQQADVQQLKKILEQKYFKGFNTNLFTSLEGLGDEIYKFSSQEQNSLGAINQIFWKNGLFVKGDKGVLLNAINQTVRGTLVQAPVGKTLGVCTANFQKAGFLCQDNTYQLYNINRQGFTQLATVTGPFPVNIKDMATYRTSNLYMMVEDKQLQAKGSGILKYSLQAGKQDVFQAAVEYSSSGFALQALDNGSGAEISGALQTGFPYKSLAVDSTFLTWDMIQHKLIQYRRPGKDNTLQSREIALAGGNAITKEFSDTTRVITSQESKYVYLFDAQNQSFVVYRSMPLKNNDANASSYKLQYFFSFKFSLGDLQIKDVYIQEGEKSVLYLLTNNGIISLKLSDYIAGYEKPNQ